MSIYFNNTYGNDGYLNNWYLSPFKVEGKNFINSEHYFIWKKVLLFKPELEELILSTESPKIIKEINKKIKNKISLDESYEIMLQALFHKFSQNPKLLKNLLWTGHSGIVNANPKDKIWGIGITAVEALMDKPWLGENLLGKALIETRSKFRKSLISDSLLNIN